MTPQGYQKTKVDPSTIRRVWAAVTKRPTAGLRELSGACGIPVIKVGRALYALRDAGYVDFDPATSRARTVRVPFVVG